MRRVLVSLVALALAITGAALVVQAPAGADTPLRYVNLGDSYSAGSGVLPINPAMPPECWQSTNNFAHVVARSIGASLTDVSFRGSQTTDITPGQ